METSAKHKLQYSYEDPQSGPAYSFPGLGVQDTEENKNTLKPRRFFCEEYKKNFNVDLCTPVFPGQPMPWDKEDHHLLQIANHLTDIKKSGGLGSFTDRIRKAKIRLNTHKYVPPTDTHSLLSLFEFKDDISDHTQVKKEVVLFSLISSLTRTLLKRSSDCETMSFSEARGLFNSIGYEHDLDISTQCIEAPHVGNYRPLPTSDSAFFSVQTRDYGHETLTLLDNWSREHLKYNLDKYEKAYKENGELKNILSKIFIYNIYLIFEAKRTSIGDKVKNLKIPLEIDKDVDGLITIFNKENSKPLNAYQYTAWFIQAFDFGSTIIHGESEQSVYQMLAEFKDGSTLPQTVFTQVEIILP